MSATATVTNKTGPGLQMTAQVLANVTSIVFDPVVQFMRVKYGNAQVVELDMGGVTTFTVAVAAGNYTLTIS